MSTIFSIDYIVFGFMGYNMSLIELFGTTLGLFSVWFAARSNILTWPATILNTIAFFMVFYQVRLYSDMFLQLYFFAIAIYGWNYWHKTFTENSKPVNRLSHKEWLTVTAVAIVGSASLGLFISNIHHLLPQLFPAPASFPYINAFSATLSVIANFLMARRKLENWLIWMLVDTICIAVYAANGILLMSLEYFILLVICIYGYRSWLAELKHLPDKSNVQPSTTCK